jgi:TatD DNase family protein
MEISLFDSHVHLADIEYGGYMNYILNNLRALRINVCSVSVNIETSLRSISLFSNDICRKMISQFIGIHPEFANENVLDFAEIFDRNISLIDGLGEIGLDPTYAEREGIPYEKQLFVFNSMLSLAEKSGKPVSIHCRRSIDDILDTVETYRIKNAVMHWYCGSKKQLERVMDMGLFVSYGPPLVYSDNKKVLLNKTDIDRILVETDGPVRYPKCFENLPSLPSSFLMSVVSSAANSLKIPYYEMAKKIKQNSESFLGRLF